MNDTEDILHSLEQTCQQQYEEIERKKLQIWDVEDDNRLLRIRIQELEENVEKKTMRVDELERWCTHLQSIIDDDKNLNSLEQTCQQQYEDIERKKVQIWDVEEENRLLRIRIQKLEENIEKRNMRVDELERWCTHLQSIIDQDKMMDRREQRHKRLEQRFGILYRAARKVKRLLIK